MGERLCEACEGPATRLNVLCNAGDDANEEVLDFCDECFDALAAAAQADNPRPEDTP